MTKEIWTLIFFYGNISILLIIFLVFVNKERLKDLIPIGLLIAAENYTIEVIGLHFGYWEYPLESLNYPEVLVISSLIYFPILAMLFFQYLSKNTIKNVFLITFFLSLNMIVEIITLKTTLLFIYGEKMNLFIAFLMYLGAYILIILFGNFYNNLHTTKGS